MIFESTSIQGVWLIHLEKKEDSRGFFARTFDTNEFLAQEIGFAILQSSISFNTKQGTVRGMHFQKAPHEEQKLVQCIRGSMHDTVLDLRPDSPTYKQHQSFELNEQNGDIVYIPKGVAHGFQTLEDNTVVLYHIATEYVPESSSGVRWNDPAFSITWPEPVTVISDKDRQYQDYVG